MHVLTERQQLLRCMLRQAERAPTMAGTLEKCAWLAAQQNVRYLINAYSGPGAVAHSPAVTAASDPAVRPACHMCVCICYKELWSGTKHARGFARSSPAQREGSVQG